ncbi:unnamed protein product [Psylliodes chrysocephalus]|uniref:Uncharacterized protein n=1 Tax=Psylliodes chrysocephalus TaxID=3402493 RepID=A0A9P0GG75_9CUCU|nr:unnamed protein product [Psylliodes chrysocephala]
MNPTPFNVKYLDHTFFKSFKNVKMVKSIRPGGKPGAAKVNDIRGLKYTPEGEIFDKLRLSEEWTILPQRRRQELSTKTWAELDSLHQNKIEISARKYSDLQVNFISRLSWLLQ